MTAPEAAGFMGMQEVIRENSACGYTPGQKAVRWGRSLSVCEEIVARTPNTGSQAARHSARGRASYMEERRPRRDKVARSNGLAMIDSQPLTPNHAAFRPAQTSSDDKAGFRE